jgi:RNA polymerase sigma factor (TIGR02999 family)
VHEAYLRLIPLNKELSWDSRGHFFAAAAEAMRRILIDKARHKQCLKHGGGRKRVDLDANCTVSDGPGDDLLALDEALTKFAAVAPLKAELVKLRFFAGMSLAEAAQVLGISPATADRYWAYARVWLYCELGDEPSPDSNSEKIP